MRQLGWGAALRALHNKKRVRQGSVLSWARDAPVPFARLPDTAFALRASVGHESRNLVPHPPPEVPLNLALALISASTAPILMLDHALCVVAASASFVRAFQLDPAAITGRPLAGLGNGEWNKPQLLSLLQATASGFAEVDGYEMDLAYKTQSARRLVIGARKLSYSESDDTRLVVSVADVTDARLATKLKETLLQEKSVLLQELHHRVANSLQIIASVLMQSARKIQSEESRVHLMDAHQRVMSVASLQKQLAVSKLGDVELRPYFTALCESIAASMIHDKSTVTLAVEADDSITTADTSVSLGLIVTELVINALKHAFPEQRKGHIAVAYRARGDDWTLSVSDDGTGFAVEASKAGLGTSIVEALARQLDAKVSVVSGAAGTKVSVGHVNTPVLSLVPQQAV